MPSVFEKYPNLPGFASEFKDGGLQVRTQTPEPGTDSVLLLGTAVDGPVGEPVAVDPNTVELVFGTATSPNGASNGSTLVNGFYEAWEGGSRDIRLMRITGTPAKASIKGDSVSRTIDTVVSKDLGVAPGNKETILTLSNETINEDSVVVNAAGYDLGSDAFTVTNGSVGVKATVTLKADTVDPGASIYVSYTIVDPNDAEKTIEVTENGEKDPDTGVITYWVAESDSATFNLDQTAQPDSLHIYADGVELSNDKYALAGTHDSVTLNSNAAARGASIEATFIHSVTESEPFEVKLESVFGGAVYNQSQVKIESIKDSNDKEIGKKVVIIKPESKKAQAADGPLEYASTDYPTVGQLVQAINADTNNNILRATVSNDQADLDTDKLNTTTPFTGGSDGIKVSKQDLYNKLGGQRDSQGLLVDPGHYQLLENYTVDTIIPLGVYADDVLPGRYDNFAYQLALACAVISHRNHTTTGVIATSSPDEAGLAAVKAQVDKLLSRKNDYFMRDRAGNILRDSEGKNIDLGRFISVVAGPDVILSNNRTGTYANNSAAGYAGFVAQLAAQSAPTNKIANYAKGLRFRYSNAQLNDLTGARYVTLRLKDGKVAVVDGPTAAQPGSDYRRLSTVRVVKEVVNQIRLVCDPYIGEPNEVPQRNAMGAAISKRLDQLKEAGVIVDSGFNIVATDQMQLMGEAQIELTIVPPQELRKITTIVGLRPSL